jgi:hypothetical protein
VGRRGPKRRANKPKVGNAITKNGETTDHHENSQNNPPPEVLPTNPEIQNPHPKPEHDCAPEKLKPAERTSDIVIANWTRVLGVSTIALVLATGGTGWVLWRTDRNIEHQAEIMRGQLEEMQTEQRPWVYAVDIVPAGRIVLVEGQYALPLKFSIKNTGHLPAFSVVPKTSASVLPIGSATTSIKNGICDGYRDSPTTKTGTTIFAGQTITQGGFTSDHYPLISKRAWDAISGEKILVMFGCIDYQFPAEPGHHQSRFSYAVGTLQNQGILERIGPLPNDPTSVEVRMLPVPIDDGTPAN